MYSLEDIKTFQKSFLSQNIPVKEQLSWLSFAIGKEYFLLPAADIGFISPHRDFQELHFLENCYCGYAYFDGKFYSVADLSAYGDNLNKNHQSRYLIYLKNSALALLANSIISFSVMGLDDGGQSRFPFCQNRSLYLTDDGIAIADLINSQKIKEVI